ncbi:hypothetical protein [Nocardia salmonicida]|uniref:hypothetical protein n=1 Tax=Nocardia salmonicida TaxID=53431 RepID=UPI003641CCAB
MPGPDKTSPEAIEKRRRMAEALRLRETGANYRMIGEALEVSTSTAHGYVTDAIKELTREPAEAVLQMELNRLDTLTYRLWEDATADNLKAVDRVLRIMERRDKLTGLDAMAILRIRGEGRELSAVDAFHAEMLGEKADDDEVEP